MKICKIMWSTNRPEYLIPALNSSSDLIDWGDHEVDGIFIDDMPTDRDDEFISNLARESGYNHIILHKKNKGLPAVWKESIDTLRSLDKEYDYIWHQEDDLILKERIKIDDLIDLLESDLWINQVSIGYQLDWYANNNGKDYKNFHTYKWRDFNLINSAKVTDGTFDTSFSLTKADKYLHSLEEWESGSLKHLGKKLGHLVTLNEGSVFECMSWYSGLGPDNRYEGWGRTIINNDLEPMSEHIGEWCWGKRVEATWLKKAIEVYENMKDGPQKEATAYQLKRYQMMMAEPDTKLNSRTWNPLAE